TAQRVTDVAQVAQSARQVAFENVRVELGAIAAADRLHEVAEVIFAAALELVDNIAVVIQRDDTLVAGNHHAVGSLPDVADIVRRLDAGLDIGERAPGRQAADLEDQLGIAVIEDADLRIGGLAVVLIAEAAADADDRFRQFVLTQPPAGLVHLVNALVAEVAVAVVPLPVPVVVEVLAHERLPGRRAAPEVVVDRGRNRLRALDLADARPQLVAERPGQLDLAELAGLQEGNRLAQGAAAAALRA